MRIKFLKGEFAVCKLRDVSHLNLAAEFLFFSRTPEEISLVCPVQEVPDNALAAEAGWIAFRVEGPLEFTLLGILSRLTTALAERAISVFAVSTYDTDYVMIKADRAEEAREALLAEGYEVT